ncbi:XdhC/CoxI family protein [Rhodococcus sp. H29-C3]|uniref:XdhC family protein n=1 Tax=Rhodococcus sp. H29-C3 TaxID=3046307 RepID=UPI0024BAD839|nr:XdhC/CoxI family protein [Rhodococcus sp. H29-C3]MDJ0362386.1 XdhC family protein [Rhodococcus sp. H29-C3]
MRDLLDDLAPWLERHEPFALATVVRTWQSSPRPAGAAMAVSKSGDVVGSVSGGCIEGALYELAQEVLADGLARTETYFVADDDAIGVGLTCGGTIEVFLRLISGHSCAEFAEVARLIAEGTSVAVLTDLDVGMPTRHAVVSEDRTWDESAGPGLAEVLDGDESFRNKVRDLVQAGESGLAVLAHGGSEQDRALEVMVELFGPPPRMYIFGAIDFAAAMCRLGKFAGFHVTVIDARAVFATRARFPDADEVVVSWPHKFLETAAVDERTVITVLTHDEKFDIPLLEHALRTTAVYIGALGSRATHDRRVDLLRGRGVTEAELNRLHSPVGLDLGARNPAETAVSIMAEVLKTSRNATGLELRTLHGPIHRERNSLSASVDERIDLGSGARC